MHDARCHASRPRLCACPLCHPIAAAHGHTRYWAAAVQLRAPGAAQRHHVRRVHRVAQRDQPQHAAEVCAGRVRGAGHDGRHLAGAEATQQHRLGHPHDAVHGLGGLRLWPAVKLGRGTLRSRLGGSSSSSSSSLVLLAAAAVGLRVSTPSSALPCCSCCRVRCCWRRALWLDACRCLPARCWRCVCGWGLVSLAAVSGLGRRRAVLRLAAVRRGRRLAAAAAVVAVPAMAQRVAVLRVRRHITAHNTQRVWSGAKLQLQWRRDTPARAHVATQHAAPSALTTLSCSVGV
jgi:hypothetical protein